MSDYGKLIEDLKRGFGHWYVEDWSRLVSMYAEAAAAIEAIEAANKELSEELLEAQAEKPHWISAELPPKYTGRYFVWCGVNWYGEGMHGDIMIARYDRNKQRWCVEADNSLNGPLCGDVRYWMPIEPPQEVQE